MSEYLQRFVPPEAVGKQVEIQESLLPVIERIAKVLPVEKVWEYFASAPSETNGVIVFPYCRVNSELFEIRDAESVFDIAQNDGNVEETKKYYQHMSESALKVLLWVEVGFEGLENLAVSPASSNWGASRKAGSRVKLIMTDGKELYDKNLTSFVTLRHSYPEKNTDCFAQFRLEHLLARWEKK